MNALRQRTVVLLLAWSVPAGAQSPATLEWTPVRSTAPVIFDADEVALWVDAENPARSLIIGVDKGTWPEGGLFVWDLQGHLLQRVEISHPNGVDVRDDIPYEGTAHALAVVTMRDHDELRVFRIDTGSRTLVDITTAAGIPTRRAPYGLALYRRPRDGALFAIVSNRSRKYRHELWQIQLTMDAGGKVKGTPTRVFGDHHGTVEGMVADDQLGYLYVAEQTIGIHKYHADPGRGRQRLALFATEDGITGNREGLALYACADSSGYLLASCPTDKAVKVYPRQGDPQAEHHHPLLANLRSAAGGRGDGLEVTAMALSEEFPHGMLIWHYQGGRNFSLYRWENIGTEVLGICPP